MENPISKLFDAGGVERRAWTIPTIIDLPPLQDLTLQSPIEGGEGGFSWLKVTNPGGQLG